MGLFEAFIESFIQNGTLGISNLLGITGKDGLIHDKDDDPIVYLNQDGLTFYDYGINIPFSHIINASNERDGPIRYTLLNVFGGLSIIIPNKLINMGEMHDEPPASYCPDIEDMAHLLENATNSEFITYTTKVLNGVSRALTLLFNLKCEQIAVDARASLAWLHLVLEQFSERLEFIDAISEKGSVEDQAAYKVAIDLFENLREMMASGSKILLQSIREYTEEQELPSIYSTFADTVYFSWLVTEKSVPYNILRNLTASGWYPEKDAEGRCVIMTDNDKALWTDPNQANRRKYIICSDRRPSESQLLENSSPEGVLIALAQDLNYFNSQADEEQKLCFQPGHPRNGETYVQHPMKPNVYYTIDSFHLTMLQCKHSELIYLLESLGACEIKVKVHTGDSQKQHSFSQTKVNADANLQINKGSVSVDTSSDNSSQSSVFTKLSQDISLSPSGTPALPHDLVFFSHEDNWQRLASAALKRAVKYTKVILEYREDYSVTMKSVTDVTAKVKLLIPSFEMNVHHEFTSELERMHATTWEYSVSFTESPTDSASSASRSTPVAKTMSEQQPPQAFQGIPSPCTANDSTRAEALFIKRTRRYVKNDGNIDDRERADLEALAQKYGIDDLRMEELIEEVFDEQ